MNEHSDFEIKKAAAQEATNKFWKLMLSVLTFEKCERIVTDYFVDQEVIEEVMATLQMIKYEGGNPYSSMVKDDGMELLFVDYFKRIAYQQFTKKFTMFADKMSMVLQMATKLPEDSGMPFFYLNPRVFVENFTKEGAYGVIYGAPRSGKTSFAVSLIDMMIERGLHVKTNILIKDDVDAFYFTKISDFLKDVVENENKIERKATWVCIIDEAAQVAAREKAMSNRTIYFTNLARIIGKLGGNLILIVHNLERDVPSKILEWIMQGPGQIFHKLDVKTALIELKGSKSDGFINFYDFVKDIPPSPYEFVTGDMAAIKFDVNMEVLWDEIAKAKEYEEQRETILSYLENKGKLKTNKKLEIIKRNKKIYEDYKKGGMNKAQLARKYGLSRSRICDIINEMEGSQNAAAVM